MCMRLLLLLWIHQQWDWMRWVKQVGSDLQQQQQQQYQQQTNKQTTIDSLEECSRGGGAGEGVLAEGDGGVVEDGRLSWPIRWH